MTTHNAPRLDNNPPAPETLTAEAAVACIMGGDLDPATVRDEIEGTLGEAWDAVPAKDWKKWLATWQSDYVVAETVTWRQFRDAWLAAAAG